MSRLLPPNSLTARIERLFSFQNGWEEVRKEVRLHSGTQFGIIGQSGSGKTALALFLAGVDTRHRVEGEVWLDGQCLTQVSHAEIASKIALVPCNPRTLFSGCYDTLAGEIAFGLRMIGSTDPDADRKTVEEIVDRLDLAPFLLRDPFTLSGGEATRAALAMALIRKPCVLILDQIYDHLFPEYRSHIRDFLTEKVRSGLILVESHAKSPRWSADFDDVLNLGVEYKESESREIPICVGSPECLLAVDQVAFQFPSEGFKLGPVDLKINAGDSAAVVGPNGSGKTTLLRTLALINAPQIGNIRVKARDANWIGKPVRSRSFEWARYVLYSFQDPDDQIFLPTVRAEIEETARRKGVREYSTKATEAAFLLGLQKFLNLLPANLPRPLRRMVCLAGCLTAEPNILLLDEPTEGLDALQCLLVMRAVAKFTRSGGAVLFVSHDEEFIENARTRTLCMNGGRLIAESRT